jgi:hypothetical protein
MIRMVWQGVLRELYALTINANFSPRWQIRKDDKCSGIEQLLGVLGSQLHSYGALTMIR